MTCRCSGRAPETRSRHEQERIGRFPGSFAALRGVDGLARATVTGAVPRSGVLVIERMSAVAVGFSCMDGGGADSAQNVDARRNSFKVIGTATCPVAAEVVDRQAFRDRADEQLIRESVGRPTAAAKPRDPISVICPASPKPAVRRLLDLGPEFFGATVVALVHGQDCILTVGDNDD